MEPSLSRPVADDAVSPRALPRAIELVGPAGSGKSSLRRGLAAREQGDFQSGSLRERTTAGALLSAVCTTGLPFLTQARRMPGRRLYRYRIMLQLQSYGNAFQRRRHGDPVTVFDQGPVYLLSILHRALRPDGHNSITFQRFWDRTLTHWAGRIDLIVVLDAPDVVLHERIRQRGSHHRLVDRSIDSATRAFERGRRSRAAVLTAMCERNPAIRVLQVGSHATSPDELVRAIANEVELWPVSKAPPGGAY